MKERWREAQRELQEKAALGARVSSELEHAAKTVEEQVRLPCVSPCVCGCLQTGVCGWGR